MRIIQVVESLDLGGLERLAIKVAVEQKRRGDDPEIYCVCRRGRLADDAEAAGKAACPPEMAFTVLRIAGGGPLCEALRERVSSTGLGQRVRIEEATNDPAGFLQEVDEMAAGLPVVATRVGGIPDFLPDDVGWLCPPGDSGALAKSMV
ncbi:MAG: glycosyltransferase [Candidatus Acidiferrales bacterium]